MWITVEDGYRPVGTKIVSLDLTEDRNIEIRQMEDLNRGARGQAW